MDCRNCSKCKNGERIEQISIKEEIEQEIINKSVTVDLKHAITTAVLPFLSNPDTKLTPNKKKAVAIYKSQIKKLNNCEKDKNDVLTSERKLQDLGHVEYVGNLSADQQKMLHENPIQNYIPWSCVWNGNSLSTPCRIVFNASMPTQSGFSLNDLLAKGSNNMNKLVEILLDGELTAMPFTPMSKRCTIPLNLRLLIGVSNDICGRKT